MSDKIKKLAEGSFWALQYIDEAGTEEEAQEMFNELQQQDAYIGGRVLPPGLKSNKYRVQVFFKDVASDWYPDGMRRVVVTPNLVKELNIIKEANKRSQDAIERHAWDEAKKSFVNSLVKSNLVFNGTHKFAAFVAESSLQKQAGLEVFSILGDNEAMLFPFDDEHVSFHMGAVKFPIDIIFLTKDDGGEPALKVAKIVHGVHPGSDESWSSERTAAVVEVNGGLCKQFGIKVGSKCSYRYQVSLKNVNSY